jgi:uncharacterized protein RhaS with RHS repeats
MFKSGTTERMTTSRTHDGFNRLTEINSALGGSIVAGFTHGYNEVNQRTNVTLADGSYWRFGYDDLGRPIILTPW